MTNYDDNLKTFKETGAITVPGTLTASGGVTGNVTGNVTGAVTGNADTATAATGVTGTADASQSTITAAAGASNVSTVTIALKDKAGTAVSKVTPFTVYKSSAADGLTLGAAASTGFSVASGGLSINNAGAVTTSIRAVSSATGGCVLSLTDTNKAAEYLVLVLANGVKISTVLSSGSYGA